MKTLAIVIALILSCGGLAVLIAPFLFPCDDLEHIEPNDLMDE